MSASPAPQPRQRLWYGLGAGVLALVLVATVASDQVAVAYRFITQSLGPGGDPAWTGNLVFAPGPDTNGVAVTDPVTVTTASATLDRVTLTDPDGRKVAGELDAGRRRWRAIGRLGYHKRYALTAVVHDPGGRRATRTSTFTTLKPANLTLAYLRASSLRALEDRRTYGVGQPVVVWFDEKIPDRAAAERALQVVTEPRLDGAWHWFSDQELHWRPPTYYPPGTRVTVNANLYGAHLGRGLYGQDNASASFTVGPAKVAVADAATHRILVSVDGRPVRDIPTSMGRNDSTVGAQGERIDFRTRSGVHVVLGNEPLTRMTSASFGLTSGPDAYDRQIEWTTHLSYAGEYVHAAPWSVADQGVRDVSHGCLNVSTENAIWFYNNVGPGDIVEVRNTGIALDPTDGLGDWNLSWAEWLAGSALSPAAVLPTPAPASAPPAPAPSASARPAN
ncbi:L,D-transpeptidase [Planosporangium mesophilum]|uniref:L,D-transpeptidase n=1 Tax=Planosporangium mesophilum TaxID=689768 RepID=UPI00143B1119|nr:Ig-like domain-containing protein [Planosporangium mesophilum]NJC84627.1 L,D-transpeptidase [Planosporangium mesophilum]